MLKWARQIDRLRIRGNGDYQVKRPLSNLLLVQFCVLLVTAISACVTATPEEPAAKKDLTASERGALLNSDYYLSQGIKIVEHPDLVEGM